MAKGAKARGVLATLAALLCCAFLPACGQSEDMMRDGYYTAVAADFDEYGWKEFITIYVSNNTIVTVEYEAKNESGYIKSWDMEYMEIMNATDGTYPNEYVRVYSEALLNTQEPLQVDAVAGATHSHQSFQLLAQAAMEQAKTGSNEVVYVPLPRQYD